MTEKSAKFFPLRALAAGAFLLAAACARAEVRLPFIISDNMVLQGTKAIVWGTASPHETVAVRIGAKK